MQDLMKLSNKMEVTFSTFEGFKKAITLPNAFNYEI